MTTTSDTETHKIIIPLDCILETHLGTAALLDPKAPIDILNNGYFTRDSNELWNLTNKFSKTEFLKKWEDRDTFTLKRSVVRNTLKFLKNMIHCNILDFHDRGGDLIVEVIINGNPYLINNQLEQYICYLIKGFISTIIDVTFIYEPLSNLTPKYIISNKIDVLFLNDFNDWFSLHYLKLNEIKCPSLKVYAPAISKDLKRRVNEAIDDGLLDKRIAKEINPFRATELSLVEHISLNFIPVKLFSITNF